MGAEGRIEWEASSMRNEERGTIPPYFMTA